jgi:hypothetical protein
MQETLDFDFGVSILAFDNILGIQKYSKAYEYKIDFKM